MKTLIYKLTLNKLAIIFLLLLTLSSGKIFSADETFLVPLGANWMSIYLDGGKIGYSTTSVEKADAGSYKINYQSLMKLTVDSQSQDFMTQTFILTDKELNTQKFEYQDITNGKVLKVKGEVFEEGLKVAVESEGTVANKTYVLNGDWTLSELIPLLIAKKGFKLSETHSFKVFDEYLLDWVQTEAKVEKEENNKTAEGEKLYQVELNISGLKETFWLDKRGVSWKEEISMGKLNFSTLKESEEKAIVTDWRILGSGKDLVLANSISSDVFIPNPYTLLELKLVLGPFKNENLNLNDRRQEAHFVTRDGEKWIALTIRAKPFAPKNSLLVPLNLDENLEEFLKPTSLIQSDNQKIISKAREIAGSEKNAWLISQQLVNWVNRKITYKRVVSRPSALEVLGEREGDCNEHAVLLAALARSIGIPTKICLGLVYQNGRFYYHAWNKVYVGEWVDVDPTLRETEVDVVHILLWEGNVLDSSRIASLMGTFNIKPELSITSP